MADTDRQAADAIARILSRGPGDPDVIALQVISAIRGIGWRPTEARPAPSWKQHGHGVPPGEEYRQARAQLAERSAGDG